MVCQEHGDKVFEAADGLEENRIAKRFPPYQSGKILEVRKTVGRNQVAADTQEKNVVKMKITQER